MRFIGASDRGLGCVCLGTTLGTNLGPSRAVRREKYTGLLPESRNTCQLSEDDKPAYSRRGVSEWLFSGGGYSPTTPA